MEDRSALFNQLKGFSQRKLKKVETKVVTGLGEQLVEKRGAKGLQVLSGGQAGDSSEGAQEPARKLDLQVGMVLPGLLMGSDDVATDKSSLESYGVTHILNLAREVKNKFEDDYNYKNVAIQDTPDFELDKIFDDCFEFIDDGRHYGNVFVHCQGTIGLSRSTALCIAYLMSKENQGFQEAWNNVKEARSFVKPNEGFQKQLKDYEIKLRGAAKVKESGIDDPFALRKKQEIEQEKAMVAGAASVKNRMKMFGANLDAAPAASGPRSKSVSPSPFSSGGNTNSNSTSSSGQQQQRPASKWSERNAASAAAAAAAETSKQQVGSKSMTPEPRSWQQQQQQQQQPAGPPPPPPPMPATSLHDKSIKPTIQSTTNSKLPPPPPPPPGDLLNNNNNNKQQPSSVKSRYQPAAASTTTTSDEDSGKRVFGRRPPPPMKLRAGVSMERQDSEASEHERPIKSTQPLLIEIDRAVNFQQLKSNFSSQQNLLSDQCMSASIEVDRQQQGTSRNRSLNQRCASPLVLMNNVQQQRTPQPRAPVRLVDDPTNGVPLAESPFKYWQNTLANNNNSNNNNNNNNGSLRREPSTADSASFGQAPKRTVSLGPKRPKQIGEGLQQSPFLSQKKVPFDQSKAAAAERRSSFSKAARELQSSLSELNELIHSPELPTTGAHRTRQQSMSGGGKFPPIPTISHQEQANLGVNDEESENKEPRYAWQEDLANWKASSSVNDLRSMFARPPSTPLELPPLGPSQPRGRLSSTSSVLKRTPWQNLELTSAASGSSPAAASAAAVTDGERAASRGEPARESSDYAIRRTVSTASSSGKTRPQVTLRNPYRSQYS